MSVFLFCEVLGGVDWSHQGLHREECGQVGGVGRDHDQREEEPHARRKPDSIEVDMGAIKSYIFLLLIIASLEGMPLPMFRCEVQVLFS